MSDHEIIAADFVALAQSGAPLRTRDRRDVTVIAVDAAAGIIRGSIAMEGELAWRRDGSFDGALGGALGGVAETLDLAPLRVAGPLDLAPPTQHAATGPRRASLRDALNDGDAKDRAPFCCD